MGDFSFSATARCEACGAYLSASDEGCDHDGDPVRVRVFREISGGRDDLVGVEATGWWMWHALNDKVGDEWIKYEYLGPREDVNLMLKCGYWDGVADLPKISMSADVPDDLEDR